LVTGFQMIARFPIAEVIVFAVGVAAAVAAGAYGYRTVGLYGDGPFASGYHRERDPKTGESLLVHESVTSQGRIRRVMDQRFRLKEVAVDADGDGIAESSTTPTAANIAGAGFSLAGDGVIDAWAFRNPAGELVRVEVSTKRNGKVDRWEHYRNNLMIKAEADTDGNGRPDRWQTYQEGILVDTIIDADEDGRPDAPVKP
jgi:hypothetical protein